MSDPGHFACDFVVLEREATVRLTGELDVATAGHLRETLHDLSASGVSTFVLDLSALDFIDSTGLSELVGALKRSRVSGGDVVLHAPGRATTKLLEIAGLDRVFRITGAPGAGPSAAGPS